jgi:hypothetical protein
LVFIELDTPVAVFVSTTLVPGTIAPVLSVTLPSIELLNCANAVPAHSKITISSQEYLLNACFIAPPELASIELSVLHILKKR